MVGSLMAAFTICCEDWTPMPHRVHSVESTVYVGMHGVFNVIVLLASEWRRDRLRSPSTGAANAVFGGADDNRFDLSGSMLVALAMKMLMNTGDDGVSSTICVNPRCKATSGNPVFSPSGAQLAFLYVRSM